jgi:hypothetical protein
MRQLLHVVILIVLSIFLNSCKIDSQKKNVSKPLRITKTLPDVYIKTTDKAVWISRDTVFLNGDFFTGYLFELNSRGDTSFVGSYFNGVEEGRHVRFHSNGLIAEERFFINGKKDGIQRGWWPDGRTKFLFNCYDNELEGSFEEWSDSGILLKQFHYDAGYEAGAQKLWWANGAIRANYFVKDGRKYGLIGLKLCSNPYDSVSFK